MSEIHMNVSFPLDDDGFFRRECPFCRKGFKIFLEKGELNPIYIPISQIQHLRSLTRFYHRIVQNMTRVKNRIKGHLYYNGISLPSHTSQWSNNFISYLKTIVLDNGPADDYLSLLLEELQQHRSRLLVTLKKLRQYISLYNFANCFIMIFYVKIYRYFH